MVRLIINLLVSVAFTIIVSISGRLTVQQVTIQAKELRWETCRQLNARAHEQLPSLGMTVFDLITSGSQDAEQVFADYKERMGQGATAGEVEIELLSVHLNLCIKIYTLSGLHYQRTGIFGPQGASRALNLLRHKTEHYDLLVLI